MASTRWLRRRPALAKASPILVPAALHAMRHKRKVVISTGTIALQEQLIGKDIPTLQKVIPGLKAVLVKGRQNYISLRRLSHAMTSQQALFDAKDQAQEMNEIAANGPNTAIGDRADLGYDPHPAVWRQVVSDSNNCLGRRCPRYDSCFYQARKEIEDADILIVNHHLYFLTSPCATSTRPFYQPTMWWFLTRRTASKMSPPTTWVSA